MNPKGEMREGTGILGVVPKSYRLISTGVHTDGLAARMNGGGVGEVIRRPAPVSPPTLHRIGINHLIGLNNQAAGNTSEEDSQQREMPLLAEILNTTHRRVKVASFLPNGTSKNPPRLRHNVA
jgi:hypothetical protein